MECGSKQLMGTHDDGCPTKKCTEGECPTIYITLGLGSLIDERPITQWGPFRTELSCSRHGRSFLWGRARPSHDRCKNKDHHCCPMMDDGFWTAGENSKPQPIDNEEEEEERRRNISRPMNGRPAADGSPKNIYKFLQSGGAA